MTKTAASLKMLNNFITRAPQQFCGCFNQQNFKRLLEHWKPWTSSFAFCFPIPKEQRFPDSIYRLKCFLNWSLFKLSKGSVLQRVTNGNAYFGQGSEWNLQHLDCEALGNLSIIVPQRKNFKLKIQETTFTKSGGVSSNKCGGSAVTKVIETSTFVFFDWIKLLQWNLAHSMSVWKFHKFMACEKLQIAPKCEKKSIPPYLISNNSYWIGTFYIKQKNFLCYYVISTQK